MTLLAVVVCSLLGLALGPWLNQVIVRAPAREPLERVALWARPWFTRPGTRREQVVCVTSAVVLGSFAARFGWHWPLVAYLLGGLSMVAVSFTDIDTMRIPDRLTFPTLWVLAAAQVVISLGLGEPRAIGRAALGAAAFCGVLGIFWLVYPQGMGFGDVKYALVLGALVGWISPLLVAYALMGASLLGSIVGIAMAIKARSRKTAFPFGPWLCVGSTLSVLFSRHLLP